MNTNSNSAPTSDKITPDLQSAKTVYRIALYGVRGSGKTCILAALTLPRTSHPKGYTCTWIEQVLGHQFPSGNPSTWDSTDQFHLGWKWLIEQRKNLKDGGVPVPNQVSQATMRFQFDFGSREHGRYKIELIDYSGELLTTPTSELSKNLRTIVTECDGLLVLAEVPYPGRDHSSDAEHLERLKGAFLQLLDEKNSGAKVEWPVALLFNKWDRREKFENIHVDSGETAIKEFLNEDPQPAQVSLVDLIHNVVGQENTKCFPVSAFGAHLMRSDGREVPLNAPGGLLKSFNLEDGFIWAAQQSDSLKIKSLFDSEKTASWWNFLNLSFDSKDSGLGKSASLLNYYSAFSGFKAARKLLQKFPKHSEFHKRTATISNCFLFKAFTQVLTFLFLCLFAWLTIECLMDTARYKEIVLSAENPTISFEKLDENEGWMRAYIKSPFYRHIFTALFLVSKVQANSKLGVMVKNRDNSQWLIVENAKDSIDKENQAVIYARNFPNGDHIVEAKGLIVYKESRDKKLENTNYLASVENQIKGLSSDPEKENLSNFQEVHEKINKIPFPDFIDNDLLGKQNDLRVIFTKKQDEFIENLRTSDRLKFEESYRKFIDSGNFSSAASALISRKSENPEELNFIENLKKEFAKNTPSLIKGKVMNSIANRNWREARDILKIHADENIIKLLSSRDFSELKGLQSELDEAEDRYLYGQILKYMPACTDQVDTYLAKAPLKAMKNEVASVQEYLEKIKLPLNLTLTLESIQWDTKYKGIIYNDYNTITVIAKGNKCIEISDIKSSPGTSTGNLGSGTFSGNLNDLMDIRISNVSKYGLVIKSTVNGGDGVWIGSIKDLKSGVQIELKGENFSNWANLTISGFPMEPELTKWRKN